MVSEQTLQQLTERIVGAAKPSRVIVFGSYGRGDADESSDLDVMVIQPVVTDQVAEMARLRQVIGSVGTGVDVLVYPEAEYERRRQVPGTLPYWARKEGRTLYAATP